jgi:hypothetical protein
LYKIYLLFLPTLNIYNLIFLNNRSISIYYPCFIFSLYASYLFNLFNSPQVLIDVINYYLMSIISKFHTTTVFLSAKCLFTKQFMMRFFFMATFTYRRHFILSLNDIFYQIGNHHNRNMLQHIQLFYRTIEQ